MGDFKNESHFLKKATFRMVMWLLWIGVKILKINIVPLYFSRGRNLNETSELSFPARLSLLKRDYNRSLRSQTKMSKKQIPFNILREFWGKIYIPHIILRLKHMTDLFFHVFLFHLKWFETKVNILNHIIIKKEILWK